MAAPAVAPPVIRDGVLTYYGTELPRFAYEDNQEITDLNLPHVKRVGFGCFLGCKSLTRATIPCLTTLEHHAFENSGLTEFDAPMLTKIGSSAFERCEQLTRVNLPRLTTVAEYAFKKSGLTEFDAPEVTEVQMGAFAQCDQLTHVNLPAVQFIDICAFKSCGRLRTIQLPTIDRIEETAFLHCDELRHIVLAERIRRRPTTDIVRSRGIGGLPLDVVLVRNLVDVSGQAVGILKLHSTVIFRHGDTPDVDQGAITVSLTIPVLMDLAGDSYYINKDTSLSTSLHAAIVAAQPDLATQLWHVYIWEKSRDPRTVTVAEVMFQVDLGVLTSNEPLLFVWGKLPTDDDGGAAPKRPREDAGGGPSKRPRESVEAEFVDLCV